MRVAAGGVRQDGVFVCVVEDVLTRSRLLDSQVRLCVHARSHGWQASFSSQLYFFSRCRQAVSSSAASGASAATDTRRRAAAAALGSGPRPRAPPSPVSRWGTWPGHAGAGACTEKVVARAGYSRQRRRECVVRSGLEIASSLHARYWPAAARRQLTRLHSLPYQPLAQQNAKLEPLRPRIA